jgi:hypothetical protein
VCAATGASSGTSTNRENIPWNETVMVFIQTGSSLSSTDPADCTRSDIGESTSSGSPRSKSWLFVRPLSEATNHRFRRKPARSLLTGHVNH